MSVVVQFNKRFVCETDGTARVYTNKHKVYLEGKKFC